MRTATTWILSLLAALAFSSAAYAAPALKAKLSGEETKTKGQFKMKINLNKGEGKFRLQVRKGEAVTSAHLHCSENDEVLAVIFGDIPGGFDVNGKLSQFVLRDANLLAAEGSCDGEDVESLAQLEALIDLGLVYVDVHTVANPDGEVRGTF